jgi:hypothetical protein
MTIMRLPLLPINSMADRHVGLTPALAESYLEAACVCLSLHHVPPQKFLLKNEPSEIKVIVVWEPPDDRCCAAWSNLSDAARDGAYACAIAAVELSLGFFAVRRAETLTGADYYIAPLNEIAEDLENCFRLEVSGTNRNNNEVENRLTKRTKQAKKGQSNLPAIVVIVGFQVKLILMQLVGE